MKYPITVDEIKDDSISFLSEVSALIKESKRYLEKQSWCSKISNGWLFTNLGYALCIFLYEIENSQSPEDNLIWVIVGDLPPMYLDTYNVETTKEVIDNYVELVEDWIEHAEAKKSLEECFPIESAVTVDAIEMLRKRIGLLKNKILPEIDDIKFNEVLM